MMWNHILDKQPEDGDIIIQLDAPEKNRYKGDFKCHYAMGMREWKDYTISWDDYEKYRRDNNMQPSNFWWILAKDFPFPYSKRRNKCSKR